jgi:predicted DNA-binding transcriptional regulator AlpA
MLEQYPQVEPVRRSGERQSQFSDECLIVTKQLRKILGECSDMHVWRLLKNKPLAFPKPFKINDRNYWRLGAVREWIRGREAASPATGRKEMRGARPAPGRSPQSEETLEDCSVSTRASDNFASRKQRRRPPNRGGRRRSRAP